MTRLEMHEIFCDILGSRNAYFDPPESIKLNYPAIVYNLSNIQSTFANNDLYRYNNALSVTYITKSPEDPVFWKLLKIPMCKLERTFTVDNLHHATYTIFY